MHLLADEQRICAVAALAAGRLGEAGAEQPGLGCLAVQVAGEFADAFPLVDVGEHLAFGEGAHRLPEVLAFRYGPDAHGNNSSGMSMVRLRSHSPRPLACGSKRAADATP